jgi:predicted transcriptional regulator
MSYILLSIHPQYIDKILKGEKTIELRKRVGTRFVDDATIFLYSTAPISAVVATCQIRFVEKILVENGISRGVSEGGVTSQHYREYFSDRRIAYFIHLYNVKKFENQIPVSKLKILGITPPQSFRYLKDQEVKELC